MFTLNIDEEVILLSKYSITPDELFVLRAILLAQDEGKVDVLKTYMNIPGRTELSETLYSLQNKGIILKSCKIPEKGNTLDIMNIEINKLFIKNLYRCSFDLGQELWNEYPMFANIQGVRTSIRGIAKKFDSVEQFYEFYGKTIRWDSTKHEEIINLIKWAKDNTSYLNCSISTFVIEHKWEELKALKDGEGSNYNYESVKLL